MKKETSRRGILARVVAGVALAVLAGPALVFAQAPPEWTQSVKLGVPILITTTSGTTVEGRSGPITTDGISVSTGQASTRLVRFDTIRRVRVEEPDRVTNGVLIGTAAGFGLGLLGNALGGCSDSGVTPPSLQGTSADSPCPESGHAAPFVIAGLGALVGWWVDARVREPVTVFEDVAPPSVALVVGRGRVGVQVRW